MTRELKQMKVILEKFVNGLGMRRIKSNFQHQDGRIMTFPKIMVFYIYSYATTLRIND